MYKCPSCGAALQERTTKCVYCGGIIPPEQQPPGEAKPEDIVEAARMARKAMNELTPTPIRFVMMAMFIIVPVIVLVIFGIVITKIFQMGF